MSIWAIAQWIMLIFAAPAAGYFLRQWRQGRTQLAYCLILIFGFIWAAGQHLENCVMLYAPSENAFRAALYLCYLGMCALGPASVYLAWCYAGKHSLYRNKAKVAALFGTGAFFYLSILTNDLHHLYYTHLSVAERSYNILFYLFTVLSYACFIYAWFTMQRTRWGMEKSSTWLFLLCFVPPVAANTWGMITDSRALDFTPLAYCLMVFAAYLFIWWHRPVSLTPIAAKSIFDSMAYPVRVNAADGLSVYFNGITHQGGHEYRAVETTLTDGNTLLIYTDITEYASLKRALEAQRAELEVVRERLSDQSELLARQSETAAELAAQQQRMEIMALLDGKVRDKLEALRRHTEDTVTAPEAEKIEEGKRLSSEALELVRRIVREVKRRSWNEL